MLSAIIGLIAPGAFVFAFDQRTGRKIGILWVNGPRTPCPYLSFLRQGDAPRSNYSPDWRGSRVAHLRMQRLCGHIYGKHGAGRVAREL